MKKIISLLILITTLSCCGKTECSIVVTTKGNKIITGRYIQSFVSGVSNIKQCDGTDVQLNTGDILNIEEK